jgi:hypothetical protein
LPVNASFFAEPIIRRQKEVMNAFNMIDY